MIFKLADHHSIANRFIAEIRDSQIQQDSMRFRKNMERIGEVLGYEISKKLNYETTQVETPLGIADIFLPSDSIVLATILRAGLPMHQGMLNFFDKAENAFVSAYRQHHKDGTFEINLEYVSCPDLNGKVLIVADPMIATGASMNLTVNTLKEHGKPKEIHLATAIASSYGLTFIRRKQPKAHIWMGALDDELTARSFIVPGLGDAGDLSFGEKLQD